MSNIQLNALNDEVGEKIRKQVMSQELNKGGHAIAVFRFVLSIACMIVIFLARDQVPPSTVISILAGGSSLALYSLYVIFRTQQGTMSATLHYVSTFFDVLIVSLILWGLGGYRTFKSVAFLAYFYALVATHHSAKQTLFAMASIIVAYVGMFIIAVSGDIIVIGTVDEEYVSGAVSIVSSVAKLLIVVIIALLLNWIKRRYQGMVENSIEQRLEVVDASYKAQKTRDTFCRYMNKSVVDQIIEQEEVFKAERKQVAVLFTDFVDFTRLSNTLPPEELLELLNGYYTDIVKDIFRYGGTLDKFTGDGLMALFGAPVSSGRDELQALSAAWKIRETVEGLNRAREGKTVLNMRIGLNYGEVVVGNIGSEERMDYTAIGQTVNVASRVEQLGKSLNKELLVQAGASPILLTEDMYVRCSEFGDFLDAGKHEVRGLEKPLQAYLLLALNKEAEAL